MAVKSAMRYASFQYLEPGVDFREFKLAKEIDRVPRFTYPLSVQDERRVEAIFARAPIVSLHDHASVFPEDPGEIFEYVRQGREWTGYEGLAASGLNAVFENFMDGTALITSKAGWKWDDVIFDLGMRFSDLAHQDLVARVERVDDILTAKAAAQIGLVPCLEAATAIENEIDRVDILYGLGIRVMGIAYSEANALGSGLRERNDGGLTDLGRQVVRRMNRLGMTIDVSHCGDRTSLETIEASEKPIFITHAGARALWNTPRMKPDAVIRACAERGGLVGVDHVALGPDTLFGDHVALHHAFASQLSIGRVHAGVRFDEVPYVEGMESPADAVRNAVRWLVAHGYADEDVEKIAGGNVIRVLRETWWR